MRVTSFLLFFFGMTLIMPVHAREAASEPITTSLLKEKLTERSAEEFIPLNIRLAEQYDTESLYRQALRKPGRHSRRDYVIRELKAFSGKHQEDLLSFLAQHKATGAVRYVRPYWIANFVYAEVKPSVVFELQSRKDIARLDYNDKRPILITDAPEKPAGKTRYETDMVPDHVWQADRLSEPTIAWNVSHVQADEVWADGFDGEDVVVAVLDTGVNYNHVDLAGNMWIHPDYPNHGYNFVDNNNNTMDYNGHGTHCAGTVAGHGAAGIVTGMAPGAKIMAISVMDSQGSGSEAGVWSGIQFAVDQGAHVMNMSLGWKHAWNPDRPMWRTTMNNALSAGVIAAVAAGNEGNSSSDIPPHQVRTPGDVPPPWLHPDQTLQGGVSAVVSVGSVTMEDEISGFSSNGPVSWANVSPFNDYPYNPEMGLIRPDVTAPGSEIISLSNANNTGYRTLSGTSMASPATAGVMALIISKSPEITPEEISQILEENSVAFTETKSNIYGSGRIHALEAVLNTPFSGISYVAHELDDNQGNNDGKINPGETIGINLYLQNRAEEPVEDVHVRISSSSPYIHLLDTLATPGTFPAEDTLLLEELFVFEVSDTIPGNHRVYFELETYSAESPETRWFSNFSETAYAPELTIRDILILDEHGNETSALKPGEPSTMRFVTENLGQLASAELNASLTSEQGFVHIDNGQAGHDALGPGQIAEIDFDILIHPSVHDGAIARLDHELQAGAYLIHDELAFKTGLVTEDWNSADFDQFDWQHGGVADWVIDPDTAYTGSFSARSGDITHNQITSLQITYPVKTQDSISFYRKVSSENNYDWLNFYIDNELMDRWSGEKDWERVVYEVEPGERTFRWAYEKDGSITVGADAGWIDQISFPARLVTNAIAGFDQERCGNEIFLTKGYAWNYDQLLWSTAGDGYFANPGELHATYHPGEEDLQNGQVNLNLQVTLGDDVASDSMTLYFLDTPDADLGGDAVVCYGETLLLDAGEGDYSYEWFDGSSGQTYLVDPDDHDTDILEVWVEVWHENGCADTDTITISFEDCTNVYEHDLANSLQIYPNPASGYIYVNHSEPIQSIKIFDVVGNEKGFISTTSNNKIIDVSQLTQGIYFVQVNIDGYIITKKLQISR